MSFKKKKDQDIYRYPSIFDTEVLEHEDQDPPYPEHLRSSTCNTNLADDPSHVTIQMVNKTNSLLSVPASTTEMISDRKKKLSHDSTVGIANTSNAKNIFQSDNPVITITKISETDNKLPTESHFTTTKPSDKRLCCDSSTSTIKPSDTKLYRNFNCSTSDWGLFSDADISKLFQDPSSNATQLSGPKRLCHNSIMSGNKPPDTSKFSRDSSISPTKSSDPNKFSHKPSTISTRSPSPNKFSHKPSTISTRCPSPNKFSPKPSTISTRSPSPTKLSYDSSTISTGSSSPNKLSHDSSTTSTRSSDPNNLSHESCINATKSSDPNKLSHEPGIIATKSLDSKNKYPSGNSNDCLQPTTNTTKASVTNKKIVLDSHFLTVDCSGRQSPYTDRDEQLSNVPLPNFQRESAVTRNVSMCHSSTSISFTSDMENFKQSIVLKSILSKNLQDLSDELFSKSEVCTDARVIQASCSPTPNVHTSLSNGTDNREFEKVQDIHSCLSSKDILNSQTLLSPVIKSVPQDLLPEGEPGKPSDTEDCVSEKLLETAETNFPKHRKSSFKTKHLVGEVSGSKQSLTYDYFIKQIFTAPIFSQLGMGPKTLSEAQMALQGQALTPWESRIYSQIVNCEEKVNDIHLSQYSSVISQIIQLFPVNTLLESGMINVTKLGKAQQKPLLDTQTASPPEEPQNPREQHSEVKCPTTVLSRQNTPCPTPVDGSVIGVEYTEDRQSISVQESKCPPPEGKAGSPAPTDHQRLDAEETELMSALENLSNSLGNSKDTNTVMLKSILKNIFKVCLKYNQSDGRQQLEKELERSTQHSLPSGTEHLGKVQETFNKAERDPILNPKLCLFLEKLSESEVKNLKSELSKHIQHYLLEKLSESGHITREDLPKICQNLCQMNEKTKLKEKTELKEQGPFQETYSETIEEIMSFVNNFNHHLVDKHLEIKLKSFLNDSLQNYFLKNLTVSKLFNEGDAMALCPGVASPRSEGSSRPFHQLGQEIAGESFCSRLKIDINCPLSNSLQNYLKTLSDSELLSLKSDLSKYLQGLFLEKLHKSGVMTESQQKGLNQQINSLPSSSTPLKYIKTNLPCRDENYIIREDSEEQKKYSKIGQNTTLQTFLEDKCGEMELTRKREKGSCFSHNLKENPPAIWEPKTIGNREGKTVNFVKVQLSPNKNIQANPLNKSPERPADTSLKKHKKEHGFTNPQAENSVYKTDIQDPYNWDGRSKTIQSKLGFEKTLKVKPLDKKENNNTYNFIVQEKLDTGFSPHLKLPTCKAPRENEYGSRLSFPTWHTNTFTHVNTECGEQSKLDQYCQKLKGNNNNNKKHLVTFAQFKNEMETLYRNPYEDCNEKCAKISDSQSFKYKENERNSRPFFFPEVLKRENMKSKRKERDHATKPKKSFHKIVRILPATLPTARPHLRKSVPRTLLQWTARRTVHDCLDKCEDLHIPSVKCPKTSKSKARLLGKSPDDPHNQAKHCDRPYTAPEPNKRRETVAGKIASLRMVSAGLVQLHTTPEHELHKTRFKRKLKEDIEKSSFICDIIQMLNTEE
ncbi:cation channel sperm-associated targeting subunit tau-like [Psammomys obesus]|uniref:cation channel sperm-associated targeting subunit tau-like n=1 Tax=Psammomys obesus TaxID=48139 RepID=UPI002452DCD0|nr:cation channel sperm-associated targeting subunit tau-like [Psammomys obesus]